MDKKSSNIPLGNIDKLLLGILLVLFLVVMFLILLLKSTDSKTANTSPSAQSLAKQFTSDPINVNPSQTATKKPTSTPLPTETPIPTVVLPSTTPFSGYERVEFNDSNYPLISGYSLLHNYSSYIKKRVRVGGILVDFGNIPVHEKDELVLQFKPFIDLDKTFEVYDIIVLVRNGKQSSYYAKDHIVYVYGSVGDYAKSMNQDGTTVESALMFAEWVSISDKTFNEILLEDLPNSSISSGFFNFP